MRFNLERKHDNVDPRFTELLNRLWKLRERARYLAGDVELTEAEMDEILAVAEEMREVLVATSPRRAPVSGKVVGPWATTRPSLRLRTRNRRPSRREPKSSCCRTCRSTSA